MKTMDQSVMLEEEEDTLKGKYLTFSLGNEMYGIEICYVTEIIGIQAITEVPELPAYMKGIINLRGMIIPVMDVRLRFKKPYQEYNNRTCIIVIKENDNSIGLIVDRVAEVLMIGEEDIVNPPSIMNAAQRFIKGMGKTGNEVKLILDCNMLINTGDLEDLYSQE
jgi:Chemotaxis signal transduction protein